MLGPLLLESRGQAPEHCTSESTHLLKVTHTYVMLVFIMTVHCVQCAQLHCTVSLINRGQCFLLFDQ